ncbi:uncharacterized protein LOC143259619 isoform X6 [Megalopta genalis]|uniref:uncharacterized protein LOC143259619 isoform X6 n=1 Tax=Megalopta genalis TaxID=115081 RepID=UPI003FD4F8C8
MVQRRRTNEPAAEPPRFQLRGVKALLYHEKLYHNILVNALTNLIFTLIVFIKHIAFLRNIKYVKLLLDTIRSDWRDINDEHETKILLERAGHGKLVAVILSAILHIAVMSFIIYTTLIADFFTSSISDENDYIANSHIKLMYTKNDEKYYFISSLHTYIAMVLSSCVLCGTEGTTSMCCFHGLAIYEILSHRVLNAFNNDKTNITDLKEDRRTLEKLIDIGILHKHLLRFCSVFQSAIMSTYFILLFLTVGSLTLNLLRLAYIVARTRRLAQIATPGTAVVTYFLYLIITNNLGQMGIDTSANFFLDTYAGVWYRGSVPAQKLLLFIMLHSMKECKFLIGGLYCPSHEGFTGIMRLSMSYLTVMYSLYVRV